MAVASECCLLRFMDSIICRFKSKGKQRTAETYRAACQSFRKFMCCSDLLRHNASSSGDDIMLDALTSEIVEAYEAYLRDRGVVPNTVSFYMRILRAAYNRAVEAGMVKQSYPFRHVYTGVDKTVKRALPLPLIRKIRTLDLSSDPALDYARDMFLLSFYLRGMSFVDMAFLRKSDLKSGCVTYRRRKTGQLLSVRWTHEMCSIVGKYQPNGTAYLLPILTKSNVNE
ncbi:MAG: site-specific integrase, partial [Duncaniella sp.]|nr:site-specific integrase [Duncaniella sp.]